MGHLAAFLTLGVLSQNNWPSKWEDRERTQLFDELVLSEHRPLVTAPQGNTLL